MITNGFAACLDSQNMSRKTATYKAQLPNR